MALTIIRLEDDTVHIERRPTSGGESQSISLPLERQVAALSPAILNGLLRLTSRWGEDLDSELCITDAELRARAVALFEYWER